MNDLTESAVLEDQFYLSTTSALYADIYEDVGTLFDSVMQSTNYMQLFSAAAFRRNPEMIKILRYALSPSLSEMKFDQMFPWRDDPASFATMGTFISENIDKRRFSWVGGSAISAPSAPDLLRAREWTCALIAEQNTQTAYRKARKDLQEQQVSAYLSGFGYQHASSVGTITRLDDVPVGYFTSEKRVQGRTLQKADLIVRSKSLNRLLLIEAKAVGVRVDAYKRVKECCDKSSDWSVAGSALGSPLVIAVIAGYFSDQNIVALSRSNVEVVWEHRLSDLSAFL